jgi:hypothetical protein
MSVINLFIEYYISPDVDRQAELDFCLRHNLNNGNIDRVFLFYNENECNIQHEKIFPVKIEGRLRYADFFLYAKNGQFSSPDIFILANSDIHFDETLSLLRKIDLFNNTICLTRYEGERLHRPHKQSQDVWIIGNRNIPDLLIQQSGFYLGLPGCDNRIAQVFHENGFNPYNPCGHIKCYHKHASNFRTYRREDIVHGPYRMLEQSELR